MVSNLTRNQAPACRLRVRAPCPPLYFRKVLKLDKRPAMNLGGAFLFFSRARFHFLSLNSEFSHIQIRN